MVLRAHFLNVGHGDCTFVELPSGRLMMIDINNSKALPDPDVVALAEKSGLSVYEFKHALSNTPKGVRSWEEYYKSLLVDPYDFYTSNYSGRSVFRYVQSHPDMDHMSGLHRFFYQEAVPLQNFWDTANNKDLKEEDFERSSYDYRDWLTYKILGHGGGPNNSTHQVIENLAGAEGSYWSEDGIEVLAPSQAIVEQCNSQGNYNNISYVLKLSNGGRSIILPGDAESASWKEILAKFDADTLKCDILKASHHGRESGYDEDAVSAMSPRAVVCSVGKKPATDASDEYAAHGAKVYSTRYRGTLTVTIWDDGDIWIDNAAGERLLTIAD